MQSMIGNISLAPNPIANVWKEKGPDERCFELGDSGAGLSHCQVERKLGCEIGEVNPLVQHSLASRLPLWMEKHEKGRESAGQVKRKVCMRTG